MGRRISYVSVFFLMTGFCFSTVLAARPFTTDDAGIAPQGAFEVETGVDFGNDAAGAGICLKHGVTERMDIGLAFGYQQLPQVQQGFEDGEIGLKFGLIPQLLALSVSGSIGDKSYCLNSIFSKGFGPLTADLNLGMGATAGTKTAQLTYGLCCHCAGERFCAGAEIGGSHTGLELWQVGCNFCLCQDCSIDAGVLGDFEKEMTLSATAGLTFAFPVNKPEEAKGE